MTIDLQSLVNTSLLEPDDPAYLWRERLHDIHGGIARHALGFPV
jgi:hypothetical protein